MGERPWTATADGVVVTVRLTPRGRHDVVEGVDRLADGRTALRIRVRAAPTGGEANASLRQLLADRLGVAASRIDVVAGASARIKRVRIVGNTTALTAAFGRLVGAA
jgi:uncharacterized protein YggU (UPF0235/DUF167 family)